MKGQEVRGGDDRHPSSVGRNVRGEGDLVKFARLTPRLNLLIPRHSPIANQNKSAS
jgi:hypothetical protein